MPSTVMAGNIAVNGSPGKVPILRERLQSLSQEYKSRLGRTSGDISSACATVDAFFDAVAVERLRRMPRDGGRLDGILRRASRLAFAVSSLCDATRNLVLAATEAAALIWGSCLVLLEVSWSGSNTGCDHMLIWRTDGN